MDVMLIQQENTLLAVANLAAMIPVFSFDKLQKAIADKSFDGEYDGIPVIKYEAALYGEVQKPRIRPTSYRI
jgi:nitrous-oxide reductase